ncbi:hypothetical protein SNE40_015903 [Patella caerulea]|uniref:Sulfatase N-terminal domain-containing protein n=2 Tax=Patella caerulea TaxID=87958 RepID=A0AAN8PLG4_PATCE
MRKVLRLVVLCLIVNFMQAKSRKNILFLVADDMRPDLGVYRSGDPVIHTPHLDALAGKSLLLKKAYVQQAYCSPSRTSLLTGRRPDTTHVYDLIHYFRQSGGNFTTIPQYFKERGYNSIGMGKIFHPGRKASEFDDPISWSRPYFHSDENEAYQGRKHSWRAVSKDEYNDKPLPDIQLANKAIEVLRQVGPAAKRGEQPFFMAVGFYKPHLPFVFPEEYLSLYPPENIKLPKNGYIPAHMPPIAWSKYWELLIYKDIAELQVSGQPNTSLPRDVVMNLRRAYYSSISYIDNEVGRVLQELKMLGLEDNTIVSFLGDHGWQLGEHGEWCKHTNFEDALHAPMMIRVPGITDGGIVSERLTEFVDLFPTLVESAGFTPLTLCSEVNSTKTILCREGASLMPLMQNPTRKWKSAAFSQYPRYLNGLLIMGYSVRNDKFRYTEWVQFNRKPSFKPNWNILYGAELYDHTTDPGENFNRADEAEYHDHRVTLMGLLHKGWRNSLPPPIEK